MSLTKSGHKSIIYTHSHYHSLSLSYLSSNESIPGATGNRKWTFLFGPYSLVIKDSLSGKPSDLCWPWAKLSPTNHPCYLAGAVGSPQTACRAPRRVWFPLWPCITLQTTNPVFGPAVDRRVCCFQMSLLCLTWHHFKPCRPLCLSMLYLSLCWRPKKSYGCFTKCESCTYVAAHSVCTPSTPCYEKYKADSLETSHHHQPKTTCVQLLRHPTILSLAPTTTKQVHNETHLMEKSLPCLFFFVSSYKFITKSLQTLE